MRQLLVKLGRFVERAEYIAHVVVAIATASLVFSAASFLYKNEKAGQTLETKIQVLTASLNNSAKLISDIEQEVAQRQALVTKLQIDADEAEKLRNLNAAQVAAVAQALRGELQSEGRSGFWVNALTNLFFAFVGAGISEAFLWFRRR